MTESNTERLSVKRCPFEDCDWEREFMLDDYADELNADHDAQVHYEEEHAGRVRIQITVEKEQLLSDRDPKDIRERQMERFEEVGYDVAFVRTEVLEGSDDHDKINHDE